MNIMRTTCAVSSHNYAPEVAGVIITRGKLFGVHDVIWESQVKENTVLLLLGPNNVACDIFRFDIVRTLLHKLLGFIITPIAG